MRIGVDFDGTLATYDGWNGPADLGEPIPAMVDRVKKWLADGEQVVIVTARVYPDTKGEYELSRKAIEDWCNHVFGRVLEVTCLKDPMMDEIWDDRAVRVEKNTGLISDQSDIRARDVSPETDGIGEFLGG